MNIFCSGPTLLETTGEFAQMDQANQVVDPKNTSEHAQTFRLSKVKQKYCI